MSKPKLRYVDVFTARHISDPIKWDLIEEIRNEGWKFITIIGSVGDAIRSPRIPQVYAVFEKETGVDEDALFELQKKCDELAAESKKIKGELKAAKMRLGKYEKKAD